MISVSKANHSPKVPSRYTYEDERFTFIICLLSNTSSSALDETSSYLSPVPDHLLFNSNETSFNHFLVLKLLKLRGFPGGTEAKGLPRWCSGKESACQCRRCKRHRFNPWVRKIQWRRKWQPL